MDRRFCPAHEFYEGDPLYRELLEIPEPDFGEVEKIFPSVNGEFRSGIFLRNLAYAYEIVKQYDCPRDKEITVLEIGGGFGMLAYILGQYYKNANFVLVDLPESLSICAWYLENILTEKSFRYFPTDLGKEISDINFVRADSFDEQLARYDLVINCDSMSEMTKDVACNYLKIIEKTTTNHAFFFFLNKENVERTGMPHPTSYPFSGNWDIQFVKPTYVGFMDDYRHIQLGLRWKPKTDSRKLIRNKLLDVSYEYFFQERLEVFHFFELLTKWQLHSDSLSERCLDFLDLLLHEPNSVSLISKIYFPKSDQEYEYSIMEICHLLLIDQLIESKNIKLAEKLLGTFFKQSNCFYTKWASCRLFIRLNKKEEAVEELKKAARLNLPNAYVLQKAAKQVAPFSSELCSDMFRTILNQENYLLPKLEGASYLKLDEQDIESLKNSYRSKIENIGFFRVRFADMLLKNEKTSQCESILQPIYSGEIKVGHYDLFMAASLAIEMGNEPVGFNCVEKSVEIGKNDNGFLRRVGHFHEDNENIDEAIKLYKMSLDIDSSWASTNADLARAFGRTGDYVSEKKYIMQALECGKNKEVDYKYLHHRISELEKSGT